MVCLSISFEEREEWQKNWFIFHFIGQLFRTGYFKHDINLQLLCVSVLRFVFRTWTTIVNYCYVNRNSYDDSDRALVSKVCLFVSKSIVMLSDRNIKWLYIKGKLNPVDVLSQPPDETLLRTRPFSLADEEAEFFCSDSTDRINDNEFNFAERKFGLSRFGSSTD